MKNIKDQQNFMYVQVSTLSNLRLSVGRKQHEEIAAKSIPDILCFSL
jgi:hypothetical protein